MAGFFDSAAGPIAGAAIDAVGSVGGGLFSANQARKNRAFQERMYNRQVEDNIRFWNMQNAYNLPSAALQRIRDAGLNPLLMYGENGVSGNLAQQAPQSAQAPHGAQASANFHTAFGVAMQQAALMREQVLNLRSDRLLKDAQALQQAALTKETEEKAKQAGLQYKFDYATYNDRWEQIRVKNDLDRATARLQTALEQTNVEERKKLAAETAFLQKQEAYIEGKTNNEKALTDQEIKESENRIDLAIKTTAKQIEVMDAESRKALADAWYARAQAAILDNPEYRDNVWQEQAQKVRKAISEGNTALYESLMAEYKNSLLPKKGSKAYAIIKVNELYVKPFFETLKQMESILMPGLDMSGTLLNKVM